MPSLSPVAGQSLGTALTGEFAVTANMDDQSLSVVPIGLGKAMPPVHLDIAPLSIATWSNTPRVVAADGSPSAHTLASLDLASPGNPTDVEVGGAVHVFTANGGQSSALVVVSDSDNTLRTFDPTTRAQGAALSLGAGPHAVAFAAATATSPAQIYVSNAGDGSVSVLDGAATTVQNTLDVGGQPDAIAVVPGNRLWIADNTANDVYEFDPATGPHGAPIAVGDGLKAEAATSDGHYLVLASSDADHALYSVDLYKVQTGQAAAAVSSLAVLSGVLALATGAETTLAYATTGDNQLVYWDLVNNAITRSVGVGSNPAGLALGLSMPNNTISPLALVGGGTVSGGSTGTGGGGGGGTAGGSTAGATGAATPATTGASSAAGAGGSASAGAGAPSTSASSGAPTTGSSTTSGSTSPPSSSAASSSSGTSPISSISSGASTAGGGGSAPSSFGGGSSSPGGGSTTSSAPPATGGSTGATAGGGGTNPGISTIGNLSSPGGGSGGAGATSGGIGASSSSAGAGVSSSAGTAGAGAGATSGSSAPGSVGSTASGSGGVGNSTGAVGSSPSGATTSGGVGSGGAGGAGGTGGAAGGASANPTAPAKSTTTPVAHPATPATPPAPATTPTPSRATAPTSVAPPAPGQQP
jgi:YVTN family beta-propeller protein